MAASAVWIAAWFFTKYNIRRLDCLKTLVSSEMLLGCFGNWWKATLTQQCWPLTGGSLWDTEHSTGFYAPSWSLVMGQRNTRKFLHLAGFLHQSGATHQGALRADVTWLISTLYVLWSQGCRHLGGDCYHVALESNPKLVYNTRHRKD